MSIASAGGAHGATDNRHQAHLQRVRYPSGRGESAHRGALVLRRAIDGADFEGELIVADFDNRQTCAVDGHTFADRELRAHAVANTKSAARFGLLDACDGAQGFD